MKKICIFFVIAGLLLATTPGVFAESHSNSATSLQTGEIDGFVVAIDVILVRPLALLALAGGAILFAPAWVFQKIGGNDTSSIKEALIYKPYWFALKRPVGRF